MGFSLIEPKLWWLLCQRDASYCTENDTISLDFRQETWHAKTSAPQEPLKEDAYLRCRQLLLGRK